MLKGKAQPIAACDLLDRVEEVNEKRVQALRPGSRDV
jgi:hypothetical protein